MDDTTERRLQGFIALVPWVYIGFVYLTIVGIDLRFGVAPTFYGDSLVERGPPSTAVYVLGAAYYLALTTFPFGIWVSVRRLRAHQENAARLVVFMVFGWLMVWALRIFDPLHRMRW